MLFTRILWLTVSNAFFKSSLIRHPNWSKSFREVGVRKFAYPVLTIAAGRISDRRMWKSCCWAASLSVMNARRLSVETGQPAWSRQAVKRRRVADNSHQWTNYSICQLEPVQASLVLHVRYVVHRLCHTLPANLTLALILPKTWRYTSHLLTYLL